MTSPFIEFPSVQEMTDVELERDLEQAIPPELRRALRAEQARRRKRREREVLGLLLFMAACVGAALFLYFFVGGGPRG